MRKPLRLALMAVADEGVPAELGRDFARVPRLPRGEGQLVVPGEIVFADRSRAAPGRFICFIPDQKRNAFTVELGWSADGQFPADTARPSTDPVTAAATKPARGFVRLSEFYSRLGEDWDLTPLDPFDPTTLERMMELELRELGPEEGTSLIRPLVDDAVRKLRQHAPAFFAAVAGA